MIYECRKNKFGKHHVYTSFLIITGLFIWSYFDSTETKYWLAYSIGIVLALGASYLIVNTKIRIEIKGDIVTVVHDGMIHANFSINSIESVTLNSSGGIESILVQTIDKLKYYIPCDCFKRAEIEALIEVLNNA
ncbi:MAG: hypothetical protein B6D77_14830 [gamma proteobacterium symbiont of Ctena orbiculata]|nr:MAG: hypothetical protein B6D77_14830 [gamma proteobacterium symbiont of Ctena orbiculata]